VKKSLFFIILILLLNTSCLSRVENRGYSFELKDYRIKKGLTNKGLVIKNIGSPSFISYIENEIYWVYFEEKVRKLLFFKPKILDREIMIIQFDNDNIVNYLQKYNLKDQQQILFNKNRTKNTYGKKGNFLSEIFNNIGSVSPN